MNTYFTISNNGVLALQNVRLVFVTNMKVGTNVFTHIQTSGNAGQQNVGKNKFRTKKYHKYRNKYR